MLIGENVKMGLLVLGNDVSTIKDTKLENFFYFLPALLKDSFSLRRTTEGKFSVAHKHFFFLLAVKINTHNDSLFKSRFSLFYSDSIVVVDVT